MDRSDRAHVLIAGGGVAALEAALALRALAEDRVSVELLAPEPHFWYRPLAVAEPFAVGEVRHFELSKLASDAGASFSLGELVSVDAARCLAYTSPGGAITYDALLIACGAVPKPAVCRAARARTRSSARARTPADSRPSPLALRRRPGAPRQPRFRRADPRSLRCRPGRGT